MYITHEFDKRVAASLDYRFDFKPKTNGTPMPDGSTSVDWLDAGEKIASFAIIADLGITVGTSVKAANDTAVDVWLSGGALKGRYKIVCRITTDNIPPRIEEAVAIINVV